MAMLPLPTLLIVDDDEDTRAVLRSLFEEEGFVVQEAGDGRQAWTLLQVSATPFLVILDLLMPHLDGRTLLQQVAQNPALQARHAFVVVTASPPTSALEHDVRALPLTAVPLVRKPFELETLLAVVRQAATLRGWLPDPLTDPG